MRIARRLQHPDDDNARLICEAFVHDRKLPSGVIVGSAKRRIAGLAKRCDCWGHQATSLLGLPSDVIAGSAKRRDCWVRQAASLLGPSSGIIVG